MRILIDIGHPAHVHYYKQLAKHFIQNNENVLFVTRDKEITIDLLKHYQFEYINIGKNFKSIAGKIFGLFWFTIKLGLIALKYKPDVCLNSTFYCSFVGRVIGKPVIGMDDTFNKEAYILCKYLFSTVFTGNYPHPSRGKKELSVAAYQELLYLHPNYFTPDKKILKELGVNDNQKYVVLRFVAWHASHDIGHTGMSYQNKVKAVRELEKYATVFITSEKNLDPELKKYQIKIQPHKMHHVLAFSSLLLSESATMASECAVLGTPSIYLDNTGRFYTKDQEKKYGLVFNYTESEEDQKKAIEKAVELLTNPNIKEECHKRREKLLTEKIDFTSFMIWYVKDYPKSFKIMKENPDYQYKFK